MNKYKINAKVLHPISNEILGEVEFVISATSAIGAERLARDARIFYPVATFINNGKLNENNNLGNSRES